MKKKSYKQNTQELNYFQVMALKENLQDISLLNQFNNPFQVVAMMIRIPAQEAVLLNNLQDILDYRANHPDQLRNMDVTLNVRAVSIDVMPGLNDPHHVFQPIFTDLKQQINSIDNKNSTDVAQKYSVTLETHGFGFLGDHHKDLDDGAI
jgi:hypothetical protein